MPTLTLKFKEKNLKRFRFIKGTVINIGRAEDNHIKIENLAVSSHHARVESVGDGYLLTDLKSKNGTFVNEEPVSTCWLRHGDNITIAKHTLVFGYTEDETRPQDEALFTNQTMVTNSDGYCNTPSKNPGSGEFNQNLKVNVVGVLAYVHGGSGEIELNKKLIRVGKNPSSDIIVNGLLVGKTSFTIIKRDDGYYLSYVAGFLKPKVNRETVKETIRLNDFDTIDIGPVTFQFIKKN